MYYTGKVYIVEKTRQRRNNLTTLYTIPYGLTRIDVPPTKMNEKKPSKSTLDDLNTQLPQEYQKFTEACLEIRRLSRWMSSVTGVRRQKMTEPRTGTIEIRTD